MRISDWSSDVCSSDLLPKVLQALTAGSGIRSESGVARCHAELANYFAAAFLMPYQAFYEAAEGSNYDVDRLAAAFGVSFEQVCHRLTTLQREGSRGVPESHGDERLPHRQRRDARRGGAAHRE